MNNTKKTLMSLIKSKKEELPIEQSFLNDFKQTIIRLNPPRKPSKTFKPSSMNCARNMYFQIVGAEVDPIVADPSNVRVCETGSSSHEKIQYYVSKMKECGFDCEWVDVEKYLDEQHNIGNLLYTKVLYKKEYETHCFNEQYNMSFLCDGIIKYKDRYFILEIKTEIDNKGLYRTEADEKHRRQSICYSLCLGIDDIMWYYEDRNFCTAKPFITHNTDADKCEIIELIDSVEQAVKDQLPPPKTDQKRVCAYCPYKTECKKW